MGDTGGSGWGWLGRWQPQAMGQGPAHLEEGAGCERGVRAGGEIPGTHQGPPGAKLGLSHRHKAGQLLVAWLHLRWYWPVAGENICRDKRRQGDRHERPFPEGVTSPRGSCTP